MNIGLEGGTSFMEDYTYHFTPQKSYVLGSHMLEICPSIADGKPSCEVHPFRNWRRGRSSSFDINWPCADAINVSLVDMGTRFRLIVNEVEAVKPMADLPQNYQLQEFYGIVNQILILQQQLGFLLEERIILFTANH